MRHLAKSLIQRPTEQNGFAPSVLFLCTGNYYRSRFAEELFNFLAKQTGLSVRAHSLGFTPHPHINPGPISRYTREALSTRGIPLSEPIRMPAAVTASDFVRYPTCIALCEREHRPMMERLFPDWTSRIQYWSVEDLAWESSNSALTAIESQVKRLIGALKRA